MASRSSSRSRTRKRRLVAKRKSAAYRKLPIHYSGGKKHDWRGEKVVNGVRVRT